MIRVKNRFIIGMLSKKTLSSGKGRNMVAVAAIILTAMMFSTIFTIIMSINQGYTEHNLHRAGNFAHAVFVNVDDEKIEKLKGDELIKESGISMPWGTIEGKGFDKVQAGVLYADKNSAEWTYCSPDEGRLPKEGTNEAACDSRILKILGIEPEIGKHFSLDIATAEGIVKKDFVLSGWWEYDESVPTSSLLVPKSRIEGITDKLMYVMFSGDENIGGKMEKVLENAGYQNDDSSRISTFVDGNVNPAYGASDLLADIDGITAIGLAVIMLLIILTGYLIIYNIFQISVAGDIKFYGLLKTIGTTPKQLRKIIYRQAIILSLAGIPAGLAAGWLIGVKLMPVIISNLNGVSEASSASPVIFIMSAGFTLITVFISCFIPARSAAKISPVEAVKYTDNSFVTGKKKKRKRKKVTPFAMALANLGRNKKKTAVTVLSLSVAVVLLNITITFTSGFDSGKYLVNVPFDFQIAHSKYFQKGGLEIFSSESVLSQDDVNNIASLDGIEDGGRVYGRTGPAYKFITEKEYRYLNSWMPDDALKEEIKNSPHDSDGKIGMSVNMYGMEDYALDKLKVFEGDISKLKKQGEKYIAAVAFEDDFGNMVETSGIPKVGEKIKINFGAHNEEYTVAAVVAVPYYMSYRYFGDQEFILNAQTFTEASGTDDIMYYAFDVRKGYEDEINDFIKGYVEKSVSSVDYDSVQLHENEFYNFKKMITLMGVLLSAVIGIVGILNFLNVMVTGISARKREFAVLQAVGMTGNQLKKMLYAEGLFYTMFSSVLSIGVSALAGYFAGASLEKIFWFITYKFTILPVIAMIPAFVVAGIIIPSLCYKAMERKSVVERLKIE